jgi:hypothetical protein
VSMPLSRTSATVELGRPTSASLDGSERLSLTGGANHAIVARGPSSSSTWRLPAELLSRLLDVRDPQLDVGLVQRLGKRSSPRAHAVCA